MQNNFITIQYTKNIGQSSYYSIDFWHNGNQRNIFLSLRLSQAFK